MARHNWGWSLSHPPSFNFNNVNVLKSYLYYHEGRASLAELKQALRKALERDYTDVELENTYMAPLHRQSQLFQVEDGMANLNMENLVENDRAAELLASGGEPLTLTQIHKGLAKRLGGSAIMLSLDRDHRFVKLNGTRADFYALTRWRFVNDEICRILAGTPNTYRSTDELLHKLEEQEGEPLEDVIFWPSLDDRFSKDRRGRWGLAEWDRPTRSEPIAPVLPKGKELGLPKPAEHLGEKPAMPAEEVVVLAAVAEAVAAQAASLAEHVRLQGRSASADELIRAVLEIDPYHQKYMAYHKAVEQFLEASPEWVSVGKGRWYLRTALPDSLRPPETPAFPRVRRRPAELPLDREFEEPETSSSLQPDQEVAVPVSSGGSGIRFVLTYPHLANGSALVPKSKGPLFGSGSEDLVEVALQDEYYRTFLVWFERQTGLLHGLAEWYQSERIGPGSIFYMECPDQGESAFRIVNPNQVDERTRMDQERLTNLELARRKAREVNLPFHAILMAVMAQYPAGIHYHELWQVVNCIRPVASSTVRNLLYRLPCFFRVEETPGMWRYDPAKRREALLRLYPVRRVKQAVAPPRDLPKSVHARVSWLLQARPEISHDDKRLIHAYLYQFHGLELGEGFLDPTVPAPETIRRATQKLRQDGREHVPHPSDPNSVLGRVWQLLQQNYQVTHSQLQSLYYVRYHGLSAATGLTDQGLPSLETIRRTRQLLTQQTGPPQSRDGIICGADDSSGPNRDEAQGQDEHEGVTKEEVELHQAFRGDRENLQTSEEHGQLVHDQAKDSPLSDNWAPAKERQGNRLRRGDITNERIDSRSARSLWANRVKRWRDFLLRKVLRLKGR